jgi:hypothetical protein
LLGGKTIDDTPDLPHFVVADRFLLGRDAALTGRGVAELEPGGFVTEMVGHRVTSNSIQPAPKGTALVAVGVEAA